VGNSDSGLVYRKQTPARWNSQKTPQMSGRQSHQQKHKQEPSVRGKFRFRTRVPKVDPRHVEFTEKPHRCRAGTRTSKTTSRNRPSSPGDDKKPPQEEQSPSQVSAPLRFTTWHNHSQQALSTTPRATSRSHAGDPNNRPAFQLSSTAVLLGNARVPSR